MNVKICKKCGKIGLDQLDFRICWYKLNNRYYYKHECRECENNPEYAAERYKRNIEYFRSYARRIEEKSRKKKWNLKYGYEYGKKWTKEHPDAHKKAAEEWRTEISSSQ